LLVLLLTLSVLSACGKSGGDSGAKKYGKGTYSTEETADGWILVKNEGGKNLGYSKDSGVELIEDNGYAFKDLNKNGKLDVYEDWRLEASARAEDLASQLSETEIFGLLIHDSLYGLSEDGSDAQTIIGGSFKEQIDKGVRSALNFANTGPIATVAGWNNSAQAYAESKDFGIPINVSANPTSFGESQFVDNLALASTFDTDFASEISKARSKQYRALGISTLLGPQIDLATDPRWSRDGSTYGEDPALSRDLTNATISNLQSTYDESGDDLGWGVDSVIGMMKHFPGDGPGEGGREAHSDSGKYNVYPGKAFDTHLIPFIDGGLNLTGSTGKSAAVMTSYSIAFSDNGEYGDLVGSAFSEYKINILRDTYGYDGLICTDWGVAEEGGMLSTAWGVEDKTEPERIYLAIKAGVDQIGGNMNGSFSDTIPEAYKLLADDLGADAALARIQDSARRITKTFFEAEIFENPYVSLSNAETAVNGDEAVALSRDSQLKSIVMLKNDGNIIKAESGDKPTVYVPMKFTAATAPQFGGAVPGSPASWVLPVDEATLGEYFNVVTDTVTAPTGPKGEDGNATLTEKDIKLASKADLKDCDYALVFASSPVSAGYDDASKKYLPISLQYGSYKADSAEVRKESVAGNIVTTEKDSPYGPVQTETKENRSYYGQTANAPASANDLDTILYATENVPDSAGVIVAINATNPMVFSEFESKVDAIVFGFGVDNSAFLDIVTGKTEPTGLLPMQMPKNMEAVEAQNEDVPRDMECYVDKAGNTYDFTFGLNWSGAINDGRVEKYNVPALTEPATKGK
jgi:beta-glucosidase